MADIAAKLPARTVIEVWWQSLPLSLVPRDEARVGQKNGITRCGAKRGTRSTALKDQRTASAYLFGAISLRQLLQPAMLAGASSWLHPARGIGAGLALPCCITAAMQAPLAEISQAVAPGTHAVLLLDQAGWRSTPRLAVPDNIALLFLPSNGPQLN